MIYRTKKNNSHIFISCAIIFAILVASYFFDSELGIGSEIMFWIARVIFAFLFFITIVPVIDTLFFMQDSKISFKELRDKIRASGDMEGLYLKIVKRDEQSKVHYVGYEDMMPFIEELWQHGASFRLRAQSILLPDRVCIYHPIVSCAEISLFE